MYPPLTSLRTHLLAAAGLCVLLLCLDQPAEAGRRGQFVMSFARRDRVIQICVAVMVLALFILMKKFGPADR